jgi:hypothetical protein
MDSTLASGLFGVGGTLLGAWLGSRSTSRTRKLDQRVVAFDQLAALDEVAWCSVTRQQATVALSRLRFRLSQLRVDDHLGQELEEATLAAWRNVHEDQQKTPEEFVGMSKATLDRYTAAQAAVAEALR